jgi:hypothetical protein
MATKFVRPAPAAETRATPYRSLPPAAGGLRTWRWLLLAYVAVAVCFLAWSGMSRVGEAFTFAMRPMLRGEAEVRGVGGDPGDPGRVRLHLAVPLPGGGHAPADAVVPADAEVAWRAGDVVGVMYRVSRDGARVRVEEAGLVPLRRPARP